MSDKNILIVEDEDIVARLLEINLKKSGFKIAGRCTSGEDAYHFIKDGNEVNLILMDIMLDGVLDGIETVEMLNKEFDIPVIFLSALDDQDLLHRVTKAAAYSYLIKPIDHKQLIFSIEIAIKSHQLEKKVRESRAWFSHTLQTLTDAVVTLDKDYSIIFCNQMAKNLGYNLPKLSKGQALADHIKIIDQISGDDITQYLTQGNWNKKFGSNEHLLLIRKKLKDVPVEINISPIIDKKHTLGYVCIFRDVTNKRERIESIEAYKKQLQAFSDNLRNLQESERTKIAQHIHDELGQYLARIKMDVTRLKNKSDESMEVDFWEIEEVIDDLVKRVRVIASELRPRILDDGNLYEALAWLISQYNKRLPIQLNSNIKFAELSKELETDLFRITQESLSNVLKHAEAKKIEISLNRNKEFLELSIADNGKGFEVSKVNQSQTMGVIGMKERARRWKGSLQLTSGENGSVVHAKIPLSAVEFNETKY